MPALPESDLSLFKNIPSSKQVVVEGDKQAFEEINNYYEQDDIRDHNQPIIIKRYRFNYIKYLWLIGVSVFTIYFLLVYILFNTKVKKLKK